MQVFIILSIHVVKRIVFINSVNNTDMIYLYLSTFVQQGGDKHDLKFRVNENDTVASVYKCLMKKYCLFLWFFFPSNFHIR